MDPAHFDESWKEALDVFFEPLLEFFFPDAHALVDWTLPVEFLDKELQQLIPSSDVGKHIADKLAKVFSVTGDPLYLLIHIEVQSQEDPSFAERMFIYHYRIFDAYRSPVMSLAILGDERATWRPRSYGYESGGSGIQLNFPVVKLLDYESRWSELENSDHPIAALVMAHLRTKSTTGDPLTRQQWKWILTRRLYERGWNRERVVQVFRMIDWMMTLPKALEEGFQQQVYDYEQEGKMPLISTWERMALERGIKQGMERGIERGIKQGREEGIQLGEQRGREEGIQLGEQRGKLQSVPVLAELGLSPEQIAQKLNLPLNLVTGILNPQN